MAITSQQRDQILKIVAGLFNGAPGGAFLSDFAAAVEAGVSMQDLARALAATNEFKHGIMGGKVTVEQQVAVLMNHFGVVADDVAGSAASLAEAYFTDSINAGVDLGDIVYTAVTFLETTTDPAFAPYKDLLNNKALVAALHAENTANIASVAEGQSIFAGVTSDGPSTQEEAEEYLNNLLPGSTLTLTTGTDTIVGTDRNDVINANQDTITALDTIDGKGGNNDKLIINDTDGSANLSLLSVSNVENLNLISAQGLNGGNADVSAWTGLTSAKITLQNAAAAQTITAGDSTAVDLNTKGNGNLTVNGGSAVNVVTTGTGNITVAGGDGTTSATTSGGSDISINGDALTEVTVSDAAGTITIGDTANAALTTATTSGGTTIDITGDALTTATISGNSGAATVTGKAVATVNLADTDQDLTIVNATNDHAITVNLEDVSNSKITDANAKTVTVNYTGADSEDTELVFAKATSLTIGGDAAVTGLILQSANQAAGLAITVTNTAGVEIADQLKNDVTFTGGAGADSVKIGATTKAIAMGAGDDVVIISAGPATGGTIDGGAGDDTLKMTATLADTLDGNTDFNGEVSGFERLHLTGATTQTLNLSNLDGISAIIAEGDGDTLTIDNLASGGSFEFRDASTETVINVKDAATGTADVLNVRLSSDGNLVAGKLTANDVETVNIAIIDTDDSTVNSNTLELVANKVTAINVSGNGGLTLTNISTTLTSFDASGVTEGAVTWATGALAAAATIIQVAPGTTTWMQV